MPHRPFAYICSPFRGDTQANVQKTREYCRQAYEAGYTPIAPHLLFPQFLNESIPEERKTSMEMAQQLLRRCHALIVCGDIMTDGMMCEILLALRLRITTTTLDGILIIKTKAQEAAN